MKKRTNLMFQILSTIAISGAILLMLLVFYWLFYPYRIVNVEDFSTANNVYHAGDTINYSFEYTKYIGLPATVDRLLVDSTDYALDSFETNLPIGGPKEASNSVLLPTNVRPGTYSLRLVYNQKVNPIRILTKISDSNIFQIVP